MAKFTDRFIVLPTRIYLQESSDQDIEENAEEKKVRFRVLPTEIETYHVSIVGKERVVLVGLRSGHTFYAYLSIHEFENILNQWTKKKSFKFFPSIRQAWNTISGLWAAFSKRENARPSPTQP